MTEQSSSSTMKFVPRARPADTPVIVDVFARSGPGGDVAFSHEWGWEDAGVSGHGTIDIPKKNEDDPGTPIHFHLHDLTRPRRALEFTNDAGGAIWVDRNRCPPPDRICSDEQIPDGKIRRAAKVLRVVDENTEECVLHYRLRFQARDGKPESYDPDITNGGKN